VAAVLSAVAAASGVSADWKGQEVTDGGVLWIKNPATPMEPAATIQLKEEWRLGGDTEDEDEFFGLITAIQTDAEGRVYILDSQLHEVKIYTAGGEYVKSIGREGEGPGEFSNAASMILMPDGKVGVIQLVPGKIVLLTKDGEPAGEHPLPKTEGGGFRGIINGDVAGDHLVLACLENTFQEGKLESKRFLIAVDGQGAETVRYHEEVRPLEFANAVIDENVWDTFDRRWTLGPDGRIYAVLGNDRYAIHVWKPDGAPDRVVAREYSHRARSADERSRIENLYKGFTRQVPNAVIKVNDFHRDVEQIQVRQDGSLWVMSSTGAREKPENSLGTYDVYDRDGRFVRQVTLLGQGDPEEDLFLMVRDRLYVVTGFLDAALALQGGGAEETGEADEEEPEPMAVICYRLDTSTIAMK
jgi:hypothetical protein